jgi:hypothetical protein
VVRRRRRGQGRDEEIIASLKAMVAVEAADDADDADLGDRSQDANGELELAAARLRALALSMPDNPTRN